VPKILVVDDKPIFREPISAALRAEGFEIAAAGDGPQAIAALSQFKPDLVILDIGLPVFDGLVVLRHMRQRPSLSKTRVIILSAAADRARVTEAVKLGISGYLLKSSFSLADMLDKVKSALASEPPAPSASAASGPPSPTPESARAEKRGTESAGAPSSLPLRPAASSPPAPARQSPATPMPATAASGAIESTDLKSLTPIFKRAELIERLKSCEELKGFSPTVTQVLKLTSSANASVDAVAKAVRQDQAMALKILKLANSSVYSRSDRVDTVHKAILRIGVDSIRQTVLNIAVVDRFSSLAFKEHISTPHFWEHSIACGIIAAELAHAASPKQADSAFTSGLLHDLGRVIFAEVLGEDYMRVLETARRLEAPLEAVESRVLSLNHADVMDHLLNAWKFPKPLIDPIVSHHGSATSARNAGRANPSEVLRLGLANRLAHAMLLGSSGNETIYPSEDHCRALGISEATIRAIESTARQQTDDTKFTLVSNSSGANWPRRAEEHRKAITEPFKPLYISAAPQFDAYRIFFAELAGSLPEGAPTLAVVHLAAEKERGELSQHLLAAEEEAGVRGLPLLIFSPAAQFTLDSSALSGRATRCLATPTPVSRIIAAINALLAPGEQRAAA
jgi:HD-like signal output (HDOD) protein/DNA-binding NarL/FixJ family response regulator